MKKYDAFISYRHMYPDIEVAKKLHRLLENFRLPKSFKGRGFIDGKWRVFIDDYELPVTSDLIAAIQEALDASRFLIVICSTQTSESEWVEKEVLDFSNSHGWDNVLPVLIEGTPETSFPKPLLERGEMPFLDVSGENDDRRIFAHIKRSRAWLCARLAGCDPDELGKELHLKDRQRTAHIAALAAGFMLAVSVYSLIVREHAIRNQEKTLLLDEQHRQSIVKAEEAKETYHEAETAVEKAAAEADENLLWARLAEMESELRKDNLFPAAAMAAEFLKEPGISEQMRSAAEGIIERAKPSALLTKIFVDYAAGGGASFTPDGKTLLIGKQSGLLQSYPVSTYISRATWQGYSAAPVSISDSGRLAAMVTVDHDATHHNYYVLMFNPETLEIIYSIDCGPVFGSSYAFLPGTEIFYTGDANGIRALTMIENGVAIDMTTPQIKNRFIDATPLTKTKFLLFNGNSAEQRWHECIIYDAETGEEISIAPGDGFPTDFQVRYSLGGKYAAIWGDRWECKTYMMDLDSGKLFVMSEHGTQDMAFSPDGKLLASIGDDSITIMDPASLKTLRVLPIKSPEEGYWNSHRLAFLRGGAIIAYSGYDRSGSWICLIDAATGAVIERFACNPSPSPIQELLPSPDGSQLVSRTSVEIVVWHVN